MPGQIKRSIDAIIAQRSKGDPVLAMTTRTKLILKGVDPDSFSDNSVDDPSIMDSLKKIAQEMGVLI
jgi:hypothetical protein